MRTLLVMISLAVGALAFEKTVHAQEGGSSPSTGTGITSPGILPVRFSYLLIKCTQHIAILPALQLNVGDANSDALVTKADGDFLMLDSVAVFKGVTPDPVNRRNADINRDGAVDAVDALYIYQLTRSDTYFSAFNRLAQKEIYCCEHLATYDFAQKACVTPKSGQTDPYEQKTAR